MSFLSMSLLWLSNELSWSINKLKQGLWCGTPTEKLSEFFDHHLQPNMKAGKSYIKDTGDLLEKLKNLGNIPSMPS